MSEYPGKHFAWLCRHLQNVSPQEDMHVSWGQESRLQSQLCHGPHDSGEDMGKRHFLRAYRVPNTTLTSYVYDPTHLHSSPTKQEL